MTPRIALEAETLRVLRTRLESLDGVEAVTVEETEGRIWIVMAPDADREQISEGTAGVLDALGIDPTTVTVQQVVFAGPRARRRIRLVSIDRRFDDLSCRITVTLEWQGDLFAGEAQGERGESVEWRTAAAGTVRAVERILGRSLDLRVIGVKQVRAFDADVMVVSLFRTGAEPQRFVGAVLVPDGDPSIAVAMAVLNALNRMLGSYLSLQD